MTSSPNFDFSHLVLAELKEEPEIIDTLNQLRDS
ncbi:hypothetical protein Poly41_55680 [Novipirellula artificiosorum]|uniref:Uncharacterized protein n=1 Tax=Novipirellula artificiosorum TaxID=2528016 RepID=A0A5C6D6Z9_9BACT|nr:hypothetical protein Poly41_55680 [Novipirellula artificiosorum]